MGYITKGFEKEFGREATEALLENAGHHSMSWSKSKTPKKRDERLVFALLEVIDFQCVDYGCFTFLSEEEIRNFLLKHKKAIGNMEIDLPSYLGAMVGKFNFLLD